MARVAALRASDSDREQVVERLRLATAEGRLTADELEERLEALYASRTYGELDALVADLPVSSSPGAARVRFPRWASAAGVATLMFVVLGMVAGAARHSAVAFRGQRHPDPSRVSGPFADAHHGLIVAASMFGVITVLAVCAAVLWLWMHTRARSDR